jgi:hypothetical protein
MKREKSKWLVALALCITSLALCISMITVPTLADPDVPGDPDYTGTETVSSTESESVSESISESESESVSESVSESESSSESVSESVSESESESSSESVSETASESESGSNSESESESASASLPTVPTADQNPSIPQTLYKAVDGHTGIFEVLRADGTSNDPAKYVYSAGNNPDIGTTFTAYPRGSKFYVAYVAYSNIYQAVKANGTLDSTDFIWAGSDKTFGTEDDKEAILEGNLFWYLESEGVRKLIENLLNAIPDRSNPSSSSVSSVDPNNGVSESVFAADDDNTSSTSPFFNGGSNSLVPNTGNGINTGIMVCIAVLAMGTIYCAYRLFRKDESSAYTVA